MSVYAQDYGYFFNSNSNDRTYNADSFETWLKPFFVSGVFTGCLQVQAQSTPDMTVKVTKGYANLDGKAAYWPSDNTLTIETASGVYDRIDTIVLRRDNTNRRVSLEVVKGTASASPSPTAPTRNSDTYELVLAEVLVGTGVTEIAGSAITDKRPDTDVCGYVVAAVQTPDFSELYAQFSAQAEEFMGDQAADFLAWFDEMKDQLSEDAAGHLQLEIDGKTDKVTGSLINGKLAGLDSNGNLTNSGYKPADFLDVGSVSYSDYGTSSTTPSIGIPQGRVFTHNGFVYKAKRNIAGNVSFSSLGASDITQMRLAYDLDALNSNLAWKQVTTWTPLTPSATGTDFTEVSVPVLDGATEIIGFIGSSTNMFPLHLYMCGSAQNIVFEFDTHLLLSNNNYDYSVAFRYDKTNKKVGFRQSAKGSSASFQTLQEIWYR